MADPYQSAKAGRLTFKGGSISKSIDKKKKKKNIKPKQQQQQDCPDELLPAQEEEVENIYTIDAAKKMNYQELFPVEAKKFGYVPNDNNTKAKAMAKDNDSTVEAALDDRVKKKADRYCK